MTSASYSVQNEVPLVDSNQTESKTNIVSDNGSCGKHSTILNMKAIPSLPAFYFRAKQTIKGDNLNSLLKCNDCDTLLVQSDFINLPSEMMSHITSFLNWGDYARLAPVNSIFTHVLSDAAEYGGADTKWALAEGYLHGKEGLANEPSLALKHLHDLAGIQVSQKEDSIEPDVSTSYDENSLVVNDEQMRDAQSSVINVPLNLECSPPIHMRYTPAMRQLATCYLKGVGVTQDSSIGLAWLEAAYQHSDTDSAHEIATLYEYGKDGVEVDIVLAAKWFHQAAQRGHVESMAEYAMCLELGCGVESSEEKALEWYTHAAELGHVTSNFSVGEMFEEARAGLPQSDSEAVLWYYKAAQMGDVDSKKALKRLSDIARIVLPGWANTLND
mmetsp:Transcript_1661/g.2371  ORF Transcript_1661/g.2371 Transcript_1661/m.2371 type:complete len:386 (-) Transcript_1661:148-1305(-)